MLAEDGLAHVMAVSGEGAANVLPPDSAQSIQGSVLEEVLRTNEAVYRRDMSGAEYDGEDKLLALGLHSRLGTPLLIGPQSIGMIALSRRERDAFSAEEIELAGLLGRLVASAVQNIRAYDAERRTVEELRRLSALRADFVSLVSHELRTPMAAVIGSARTLQQRWRELTPDQRESFLGLIADETERLASLVSDVLDTSRIDAGTFNIRFGDVDLAELVRDTVALAELGSDEVGLRTEVHEPLPQVRGDAERLRQVLVNLIDNAIKYSPAGDEVEVRAYSEADRVLVDIRDHGPGIAPEDQRLIFEKFGRVTSGNMRPGHRPRPLHRALDRRGPRRNARGLVDPPPRGDVHARASAPELGQLEAVVPRLALTAAIAASSAGLTRSPSSLCAAATFFATSSAKER